MASRFSLSALSLWRDYAWLIPISVTKAHFFLSLGFGIKREIRAFAKGSSRAACGGKKEMIIWIETPKGKSLLGISVIGFEEEE